MRQKATVFEFISYKFEPYKKRVVFNYKTEFSAKGGSAFGGKGKKPIFFTETVILPKIPDLDSIPKEVINKLLEALHIILGVSYYKFYCASPDGRQATKVKLRYNLSKREADFWNAVYKKGLGEFFYKNKLDPKISPKFPYSKSVKSISHSLPKYDTHLVGVGGGKDSIVLAELLKENGFNITAFYVKTGKGADLVSDVIEMMGANKLKIRRFLDSKVRDIHQYNGHVPISAIYAFLGVLSCVLYKYSYFIVSNEYSSNFGNINYKGLKINHQWSKSFEFEKLFQDYVNNFISPDIKYFSLLRSFYEIRIVKMFSKLRKYFSYFSSCNKNFTLSKKGNSGLWCNQCAKCVFVFTLLSAFLGKKELTNIFKKNLYEEKKLLPLFKDILGFGKIKPFDCVGTFKEAQTALCLAKNKFKNNFIMRQLVSKTSPQYYKEVFATNNESSVPEHFKFLGMENVLILGYGKEGEVTKKYLKKYYPNMKIGIADDNLKKSRLQSPDNVVDSRTNRSNQGSLIKYFSSILSGQENFDIAVKTPGIKKELIKIPYTTATNIFFSKISGKNKIIGVTGSKGKSTVSSLIFAILNEAGKNVKFLGNIGKPMLECLLSPIEKDAIFVLELSSYQLSDVKFSPDIAVLTSLFEEHMDYHGNIKNYYGAKKNIISFQNKNNYFVYNLKNKNISSWLKNYKGKAISFFPITSRIHDGKAVGTKSFVLKQSDIPLIGKHNKDNIKAAISVARILDIKDIFIKKAVKNFKGLPHRLEFAGEFKRIKFYDDAISTTPESTIMAIKSLKNIDTVFLGGQDRGYDFSKLEKTIKKYKIKNIALFPDSGSKIFKSIRGLNIIKTDKMENAVKFAYKNTKAGGICLLSCASPSYSLWKNFEEKGNEFKKIVKKLAKQ